MINAAKGVVIHKDAITGEGDDVIGGKGYVAVMERERRIGAKTVIQVSELVVVWAGQELGVESLPGLAGMIDGRIPCPEAICNLAME